VGSPFPIAPEDVSAEWLTGALRDAHAIDESRISSLTFERIGEGVGFVGQVARFALTYDAAEAGAPSTIIGKFPSALPAGREFAAAYGLYRCEVNVYAQLSSNIPLRIPRCYFASMNDDASEFLLLLEDLSAMGRLGDQVTGATIEDARTVIDGLARLAAAWWQSPKLDELHWLPLGADLGRISLEHAYPLGWRAAIDQYERFFSPAVRAAAPTLNERLLAAFDRFDDTPLTLMHADWRLDNFFFGAPGGDFDFAVIDWQVTNRGWSAYDLACFLGANLAPDLRRDHEQDLLHAYHGGLTSAGVRDYPIERLREDYSWSTVMYLANMIGNLGSLDTANERGVALFETMLSRIATTVADLDALKDVM
jgi:hypothetical protein